MALTEKQLLVLDFLKKQASEGIPPTVREICRNTGIKSTSSVHAILQSLEEQGYITRGAGASRSIKIEGISAPVQVPVLGRVTAGVPILAVEQIEDYIPFSSAYANGRELFALRVSGLSMINAGILDGDIVVCEQTSVARNGEIVVAMIEDEATVKRFFKEDGRVRLQPENPDFEPIISDNVVLLGKVVALFRQY